MYVALKPRGGGNVYRCTKPQWMGKGGEVPEECRKGRNETDIQ